MTILLHNLRTTLFCVVVFARLELSVFRRMQVVFITTSIGRQLLFPSLFGATHKTLPEGCQRTSTGQSAAPIGNVHGLANFPRRRSTAGLPAIGMEVWGFEPQTYGLQSHRSSHLSYTPHLCSNQSGPNQPVQKGSSSSTYPRGATQAPHQDSQRKEKGESLRS